MPLLPSLDDSRLRLFASCAFAAALGIAFVVAGFLPLLNALLLLPFTAGVILLSKEEEKFTWLQWGIFLPTVLLGFFVAIFRPPEFSYPIVYQSDFLHDGGKPFTLAINLSKAIGGYVVLLWLLRGKTPSIRRVFSGGTPLFILGGIITVIILAKLFGIAWMPKISEALPFFVAINLFVTVVSEEAFFRILLYDCIVRMFQNSHVGLLVGFTITTLLFALSHSAAFGPMFILFVIAGAVYGLVYAITKNFYAAVLVHFGVNISHFIFLEYPL